MGLQPMHQNVVNKERNIFLSILWKAELYRSMIYHSSRGKIVLMNYRQSIMHVDTTKFLFSSHTTPHEDACPLRKKFLALPLPYFHWCLTFSFSNCALLGHDMCLLFPIPKNQVSACPFLQ